jgi:hypothetical protein
MTRTKALTNRRAAVRRIRCRLFGHPSQRQAISVHWVTCNYCGTMRQRPVPDGSTDETT